MRKIISIATMVLMATVSIQASPQSEQAMSQKKIKRLAHELNHPRHRYFKGINEYMRSKRFRLPHTQRRHPDRRATNNLSFSAHIGSRWSHYRDHRYYNGRYGYKNRWRNSSQRRIVDLMKLLGV